MGEEMASMRNGQGDEWFCVFSSAGLFLKGFDHESPMSPWAKQPPRVWPGVLNEVPETFKSFLTEPAFSMADTTFCIWRGPEDAEWRTGRIEYPSDQDPDGSEWMMSILDGDPQKYQSWAESYWERPISLELINHVYEHRPLSEEFVQSLNPKRDLRTLAKDIKDIAYPS